MNERSDGQEWSLHAHVTITHPGINEFNTVPQTRTERDENGTLRMVYTWTSDPNTSVFTETRWTPERQTGHFGHPAQAGKPEESTKEYRKGNLVFTSVPPKKPAEPQPKFYQKDSGYSSELLSPSSFASSTLPRKQPPYNRRCRSTCSIVLSTTFHQEQPDESQLVTQCNRTHSLRCQTPNARTENRSSSGSSFYGCGDPWCHHFNYREDSASRFSPLRETAEEDETSLCHNSSRKPSRVNTYMASSGTRSKLSSPGFGVLKDACVQTTEVVDKCTSPLVPTSGGFPFKERYLSENAKKNAKRRAAYNTRTRSESSNLRTDTPSTYTPDSLEANESTKKVISNPSKIRRRTPVSRQKERQSPNESKSSEANKKPRTVHIDVYCTGTDIESETSSEPESKNKSTSTPQTVFESDLVRIMHARASDKDLPHRMTQELQLGNKSVKNVKKIQEETDDEVSTAYPSRLSSYSRIPSLSSFASSFPLSWSAYSTSSCAVPDNDYDSVTNTSWKDTFSDIDSLRYSKSSIAQTDSADFVPRYLRCQKSTDSIEEVPEQETAVQPSDSFEYIDKLTKKRQQLHKLGVRRLPSTEEEMPKMGQFLETSSQASLQASDSFEYANSDDKSRIKTMEEIWKDKVIKPKEVSKLEKKHLIQQQKMKEYFHSRMSDKSATKDDSDTDSSSSERRWTFEKDDNKKLERDVTVRRASKENNEKIETRTNELNASIPEVIVSETFPKTTLNTNTTIPLRTPSFIAFQQKLQLDPTLKAPFTLFPGVYTDQRSVAKRFGTVVDAFKKPGHHIGPAKNPHCQCDHCKNYFENSVGRGRTLSVGNISKDILASWKRTRHSQPRETTQKE